GQPRSQATVAAAAGSTETGSAATTSTAPATAAMMRTTPRPAVLAAARLAQRPITQASLAEPRYPVSPFSCLPFGDQLPAGLPFAVRLFPGRFSAPWSFAARPWSNRRPAAGCGSRFWPHRRRVSRRPRAPGRERLARRRTERERAGAAGPGTPAACLGRQLRLDGPALAGPGDRRGVRPVHLPVGKVLAQAPPAADSCPQPPFAAPVGARGRIGRCGFQREADRDDRPDVREPG